VTASESGESRRLDEECIKTLTGGDQVTVRFLYKEHFDFTPTFKLWLAVNTLPKVRDYSDGFWRRVLVVPFDAQFKGDDCDPTLINTLKSELPGIVNWAIEGFEKWCEKGLSLPDEVINATKSYQQESDIVAEFLSDCVLTSVDQEYSVPSAILFSEFLEWCSRQHQTCNMSRNAFTRQVGATSGTKVSKKSGVSVFIGFQLIAQER
jgi:putative DNA primase/helicase